MARYKQKYMEIYFYSILKIETAIVSAVPSFGSNFS